MLPVLDAHDGVDDQRLRESLVGAAQRELVRDRNGDHVRDHRAIQCREKCDGHCRSDLLRVAHGAQHLHETDQCADHAHRRRRVSDCLEDRLAIAVPLQREVEIFRQDRANDRGVVAVDDEVQRLLEELVGHIGFLER